MCMTCFANSYIVYVCSAHRIVREFLDEIIASTVHRCTEVEFMDQSVSGVCSVSAWTV